jgi:hypothetical protein
MRQVYTDVSEVLPVAKFGMLASILSPMLSRPSFHLTVGLGILVLDGFSGPDLRFPTLFVVPVVLSAWFCSVKLAYALALLLPIGRLIIASYLEMPANHTANIINALIRIAVLVFLTSLLARIIRLSAEIRILRGLLPTCMYCKRIRNEKETWEQMESYISRHSEAHFSHGLCPECMDKHHREPSELDGLL